MKDVRWWKIGAVRILSICVMAIGFKGLSYNFDQRTLWDLSHFSGPTSVLAVLIGLALFILGFRTERDYEKISRFPHT